MHTCRLAVPLIFAREARIAERIALAAVKDAVTMAQDRWPDLLDALPTPPAMKAIVLERLRTLPLARLAKR